MNLDLIEEVQDETLTKEERVIKERQLSTTTKGLRTNNSE